MRWYRLTQNKCPECSKRLSGFKTDFIKCKCGFGIALVKFEKIVNDILSKPKPYHQQASNQEALNNF